MLSSGESREGVNYIQDGPTLKSRTPTPRGKSQGWGLGTTCHCGGARLCVGRAGVAEDSRRRGWDAISPQRLEKRWGKAGATQEAGLRGAGEVPKARKLGKLRGGERKRASWRRGLKSG